eukprot:Sro72_g039960.2  (224) ;mRNA; r:85465-86136
MDTLIQNNNNSDDNSGLLLYVQNGDELVVSHNQQSFPCGKVVRSTAGGLFNPVLALDIVMTNGGWVLLEHNRNDMEEAQFLEEVNSLMTFLVGSSTSTTQSLNGDDDVDNNPKRHDTVAGSGMAIECVSQNVLVEVSKSIMTMASIPTGTTSTSPGGILLPSSTSSSTEKTENDLILVEGGTDEDQPLPLAMVLPLDFKLWKAAIEMIADPAQDTTIEDEETI